MDIVSKLKDLPLFKGFDEKSLRDLVIQSLVIDAPAGTKIIQAGQSGDFLGVVMEGTAEARKPVESGGTGAVLGTLAAGKHFGEMALLTGELTSADVVAANDCKYLRVPQPVFARSLAMNPVAIGELAKTLATRLRNRSQDESEQKRVEDAWISAEDPYRLRVEGALGDRRVLVINCGSSSLKYCWFDGAHPEAEVRGLVERIGIAGSRHKLKSAAGEKVDERDIADHAVALGLVLEGLGMSGGAAGNGGSPKIDVVGHRVVHGGDRYASPVLIDDDVIEAIKQFSSLAPLHNPPNLLGIETCRKALPGVPQVAVFDTAFHGTLPPFAFTYGISGDLAKEAHLRRYGFHGPSHQYVSLRTATALRRPVTELKIISCHLGNGASVCAIDHGRSVDTSMGFSPLEGLVMGTRSGDIDPGLVLHLINRLGMAPKDVEKLLTNEGGIKGVSGISSDMREIEEAAGRGEARALLAVQMYAYRVKKYIGAYAAALGGVDVITFEGGIGENSAGTRARILQGMERLGVTVDETLNRAKGAGREPVFEISAAEAPVKVMVVPTNEELMIARESVRAMGNAQVTSIIRIKKDQPIPVEVSAHHLHLTQEHVELLFGAGHKLTKKADLSQPGQFACNEIVDLVVPRGRVDKVRVLGPVRPESQVEISRTEEFKLGIDAPIRASGDVKGTPGLTLVGPAGSVVLQQGVICALRHIHMSPEDALAYGLKDRDMVRIRMGGERELIFGGVLVSVHPDFRLAMHIATDEGNAAEISAGAVGFLEAIQERQGPQRRTMTSVPVAATAAAAR